MYINIFTYTHTHTHTHTHTSTYVYIFIYITEEVTMREVQVGAALTAYVYINTHIILACIRGFVRGLLS